MSSRTVARFAATRVNPPLSTVGAETLGGVNPTQVNKACFRIFLTVAEIVVGRTAAPGGG